MNWFDDIIVDIKSFSYRDLIGQPAHQLTVSNLVLTGTGTVISSSGISVNQHAVHLGTSPTITAGGGTSPSIVGKDEAFLVTIGTGGTATNFTVTFANAFANAPVCCANSNTDIVAFKVSSTTTTVTVTATAPFTASSKVNVICRGWE